MSGNRPLLEVNGLKKHFPIHGGVLGQETARVYAVDGVSFNIDRGETLSLVGESGCGKSTVGKTILRLLKPTAGEVYLAGERIDNLPAAQLRPLRQRMQVVFQDPFSSLNPRMKVRDILAEPIRNFGLAKDRADLDRRLAELMDKVRLPHDAIGRFPHEFSGGQRQRIGIARALAPGADLIICDEAVSALDVSVKAQIINLLADLQAELRLTLLFISHDLAIVEHLTHRVAVMYLGKIVELADRRSLFASSVLQPCSPFPVDLAHPHARDLAPGVGRERRNRGLAYFSGIRTAGMEGAPGGRIHRRGRIARQHDPLAAAFDFGIGDRNRAHQGAGVGMAGIADHLVGAAQLDDLAEIHHGHPVGNVPHHREVVGDEDHAQAHLFHQVGEQVEDLRLDRHV
jgi:peptide/nickel transport system ATP-binding protein